ncbi:MAG: RnfABCDGE type electron transport complex subunit G [Bacteroidales bacterium]|nr:MAG: RnfABCDGE type electron transport complex subunit G [Bacteroidales bacterium]
MSRKESTFSNMVVTLFLVTLVSSAALGFIYELTKKPIEDALLNKRTLAFNIVLPEFDNDPVNEMYRIAVEKDTFSLYLGKKDGKTVGIAVETASQGYGGEIKLIVGFLPDGSINEVAVLEHKETAGLGDKILKSKSDWSTQFEGKNPEDFKLSVTRDGGNVDAITASTITSRAYCEALQKAYNALITGGEQ